MTLRELGSLTVAADVMNVVDGGDYLTDDGYRLRIKRRRAEREQGCLPDVHTSCLGTWVAGQHVICRQVRQQPLQSTSLSTSMGSRTGSSPYGVSVTNVDIHRPQHPAVAVLRPGKGEELAAGNVATRSARGAWPSVLHAGVVITVNK